MKIDFVIPRYGSRGGAENALGTTASKLAETLGWDITVHATCSSSSLTWSNTEEPGISYVGKLAIKKYLVDSGRSPAWSELNEKVKQSPSSIDAATQDAFFHHQGPVSTALRDGVANSEADLIIFGPYLFWSTIAVLPTVAQRSVVVPAAHDEPFLRLSRVREMLSSTMGLIYGCTAERKLLESVHPIAHLPQTVLGWGIDVKQGDSLEAQTEAGIDPSRPYIICIGRIEHAKGTVSLAQFWKHYCTQTGTNYQLVLLGENNAQIPSDHDICVVENANDHTKWGLLRGADLLINPSAMESFSLVIFEAWAANKPVLVNKHCGATNGHIIDSSGGLAYGSYLEFESALSRLLDDSDLRNTLGRAGKAFGSSRYNWDSITNRLESFINRILVQKRPS